MLEVLRTSEVIDIINNEFRYDEAEEVGLLESLGRIVSREIISPEDLPPFSRSTVDGYAVFAADTFGSSEALPSYLTIQGEVRMGEATDIKLERYHTVYVPTGGMLPEGADSVVMIEYTERLGKEVTVARPVAPGENIISRGDDVKRGDLLFTKGHRIRPQDVGVLAALGIIKVPVFKKLRVGILSTGDELVSPGENPGPGEVRDINLYSLAASVVKDGGTPEVYGIVKDDFKSLRKVLSDMLLDNDIVLISGGSSVGVRDMTERVMGSFDGSRMLVHGVSVKPGKPTLLACIDGKAVFGLPGHPVSALTIYGLFVRPIISHGELDSDVYVTARMAENYSSNHGREEYLPVRLEEDGNEYLAYPVYGESGLITSLTRAHGVVRIEAGREGLNRGQVVKVRLY
ncbi:gephyrin-like molybdotransferase Glp [Calorimonas adulescens]|uniref:Molybdopterin molybdenumtransferase n=1 Tax=Calorimonas adulescens TaxID=2606906 RepID=A0A5D8QDA9_9THEO|nr:gephyrin-like molybdotransferase Glp [Calorimonas adulescens]TZE82512.1 molybdopterin molybdotransferase MoeA [Calorimonas adulescens]